MMQLIIHAKDNNTGQIRPAYRVLVRESQSFVQPLDPQWAVEARKVERALHHQNTPHAQAVAVAMELPTH